MNCTGVATTFVYDGPWGLLLTEAKDVAGGTENDRFTEYKYGDSNEKTQQTKKAVKLYTDGSGGPLEQTAYGYNLQGRMATVTIDSNGDGLADTQLEYEYNDHGIRTAQTKTTDGNADGDFADAEDVSERTDYLIDERNPTGYAQVLEEWLNGNLSKTYTIGHDVFAEAAVAGAVRRLLKDGHGSTRMLVNAAGLPLSGQIYRFDAYGNAIGFDPALALTTLLYNAEQFDWRTGLTYLRARYYDPASGRFNRLDPFRGNLNDPQSLHKYAFCWANPVNGDDPSGLEFSLTGMLSSIGSALLNFAMVVVRASFFVHELSHYVNIAGDLRNTLLRRSEFGKGGYAVDAKLLALRTKVIARWNALGWPEKLEVVERLQGLPGGLFAWDIAQMTFDEKPRWTENLLGDVAEETLTYAGHVFPVADVNYLLWGMVNGLAFEDGITKGTDLQSAVDMVIIYRSVAGGYLFANELRHTWRLDVAFPQRFDTTLGRVAWTEYGWYWAVDPNPRVPVEVRLPHAAANANPWPYRLSAHAGGHIDEWVP